MAILTVGPISTFPSIAAAMADAVSGDTVSLESGYSNETAQIALNGITVEGDASSTGIILLLGVGIATFTLAGAAPIAVVDGPDGNGIVGNAGNNLITVSSGVDAVDGGAGTDRVVVDYRLATGSVTGNSTSNFTEAGGGGRSVTITNGTVEHFTVLTGAQADTLTTGDGNDLVNVFDGANTVTAGGGNNTVSGGSNADTFTVADGDNVITAGDGANTVVAGQGANTITGGNATDVITALDGGNFVDARDGDNTVTTGDGNDTIFSGNGTAIIVAGGGEDQVTVKAGAATVNAGSGTDRLTIDFSALTSDVTGGTGAGNAITGYTGHVEDGASNSVDFVATENLTIFGGSGNDGLVTGDGADVMEGNDGADTLTSGDGDDQFSGGNGSDALNGGEGTDIAYYSGARSDYTITFDVGGNPVLVVDNRAGSPEGSDTLTGIEIADFALNSVPSGTVIISGTPTEDQTLTASNTLVDADGLGTIDYQWQSDGTDIAGATGATLVLGQAQVGTAITVVASYTDGGNRAESIASTATAPVANVNDLPIGPVTISGTAAQGQVLTASQALADEDGLGTIAFQWRADGTNIAGATGTTLTLTQAQVGTAIDVIASYTDQQGTPESVGSSPTFAVLDANDVPSGTVIISGTPTEDQTLTASNTLVDADGLGTIDYQWQSDGTDIAGATGATLVLGQAQVGTAITVVASYTDGGNRAESIASTATAPVANVNDLPIGPVTISGTAAQGQVLTASQALADEDGLGTIAFQWRADGTNIAGATGTTLTLTQAQVGTAIDVIASYTDQQGTPESVGSSPTFAVLDANDVPSGTVIISGTPTEDQTLTASNTLVDADGLGTIDYQWQSDGTDIAGATGATLVLGQAQVGTAITVVASYTDGGNRAESIASTATAPVANVNDLPIGPVTISGTAAQGQVLTASQALADEDGLGTIAFQWRADGTNIAGATGTTLTLTQAQVGTAIDVIASYTDQQGTPESVGSSPTSSVAPPALPYFQYTLTPSGSAGQTQATAYQGPVAYLVYEFAGSSSGEAVLGTASNDFIHLGAGDDAANGGAGDDVIDGGTGSSFLTGGEGRDVFFLDGRNGQPTWSTITDWHAGDELSLWGWVQGVSRATWLQDAGADGYRGVTLHADLDANGVIDTSVTWTGLTQANLPTPTQHDNVLWFA